MEEGSAFLRVLTSFFPPLVSPHSDAPPSASPPLHGLPTPPLAERGSGGGGGGVEKEQQFTSHARSPGLIREFFQLKWRRKLEVIICFVFLSH